MREEADLLEQLGHALAALAVQVLHHLVQYDQVAAGRGEAGQGSEKGTAGRKGMCGGEQVRQLAAHLTLTQHSTCIQDNPKPSSAEPGPARGLPPLLRTCAGAPAVPPAH